MMVGNTTSQEVALAMPSGLDHTELSYGFLEMVEPPVIIHVFVVFSLVNQPLLGTPVSGHPLSFRYIGWFIGDSPFLD